MFKDCLIQRSKDYTFVNILNPGDHDYPVAEHFWDCGAQPPLMRDYTGAQSPDEGIISRDNPQVPISARPPDGQQCDKLPGGSFLML